MFFLLILDSRDAFDLSLLETNLTGCYLRSSSSPLPRSLSSFSPVSPWSPLWCPPSLDTNKWPSSERWIQSFAFIGDTILSSVSSASQLHIALWTGVRELRVDLCRMYSSLVTMLLLRIMVQSKYPPDQTSDVLMLQGEIEWHFQSGIFSPQIKIWKSYWHSI